MQVTVTHEIELIDGNDPSKSRVPLKVGTYEVDQIDNPYGHNYMKFWALKGTKLGLTKMTWEEHEAKGYLQIENAPVS